MDQTQQLEARPMTAAVLRAIFDSDQEMYPAPLTYARLKSWVEASPDFSRCYFYHPAAVGDSTGSAKEKDAADPGSPRLAGACIALPLREGPWRDLLAGQLRETDVDAPTILMPSDEGARSGVGLHVFHVERFDGGFRGSFASQALQCVTDLALAKGWNILGCSALTATPQGARSFEKLGFRPTGYEELWVEKDGQVRLLPVFPGQSREALLYEANQGLVRGEAKMAARFSEAESG